MKKYLSCIIALVFAFGPVQAMKSDRTAGRHGDLLLQFSEQALAGRGDIFTEDRLTQGPAVLVEQAAVTARRQKVRIIPAANRPLELALAHQLEAAINNNPSRELDLLLESPALTRKYLGTDLIADFAYFLDHGWPMEGSRIHDPDMFIHRYIDDVFDFHRPEDSHSSKNVALVIANFGSLGYWAWRIYHHAHGIVDHPSLYAIANVFSSWAASGRLFYAVLAFGIFAMAHQKPPPLSVGEKKRNREKYSEIIKTFGPHEQTYERLYQSAKGMDIPDRDIQDVLNNAWMYAFRNRKKFRGEAEPSTYFYSALRTAVFNYFRTQQRRPGDYGLHEDVFRTAEKASYKPESDDLLIKLRQEIMKLKPEFREVVQLWLSDHDYDQIAGILRIPLGTVKSRMNRSKEALKSALSAFKIILPPIILFGSLLHGPSHPMIFPHNTPLHAAA